MTYSLHFLPEVEQDALAGYQWYEKQSPGLGEDFLRVFYASASELPQNPLLYPQINDQFRRRLLKRFPYALYFTVENDKVIVVGLFHCARDPRGINKEIRDRKKI